MHASERQKKDPISDKKVPLKLVLKFFILLFEMRGLQVVISNTVF